MKELDARSSTSHLNNEGLRAVVIARSKAALHHLSPSARTLRILKKAAEQFNDEEARTAALQLQHSASYKVQEELTSLLYSPRHQHVAALALGEVKDPLIIELLLDKAAQFAERNATTSHIVNGVFLTVHLLLRPQSTAMNFIKGEQEQPTKEPLEQLAVKLASNCLTRQYIALLHRFPKVQQEVVLRCMSFLHEVQPGKNGALFYRIASDHPLARVRYYAARFAGRERWQGTTHEEILQEGFSKRTRSDSREGRMLLSWAIKKSTLHHLSHHIIPRATHFLRHERISEQAEKKRTTLPATLAQAFSRAGHSLPLELLLEMAHHSSPLKEASHELLLKRNTPNELLTAFRETPECPSFFFSAIEQLIALNQREAIRSVLELVRPLHPIFSEELAANALSLIKRRVADNKLHPLYDELMKEMQWSKEERAQFLTDL